MEKINRDALYCPVCGKEFYLHCEPEVYGWRKKRVLFCSYGCLRKAKGEVGQKTAYGFSKEVEA